LTYAAALFRASKLAGLAQEIECMLMAEAGFDDDEEAGRLLSHWRVSEDS